MFDETACWTSPFDAFWEAPLKTFVLSKKIFWNASCVPEAAVLTMTSIVEFRLEPLTAPQSRTEPPNTACTWAWLMFESLLSGLVTTQIASRAILLNTSPPGSLDFGSREDMPRVTRPRETSAIPTSEPP